MQAQRRLQRRQRELVDPHRARERMSSHALDRGGLANGDAGLRPAEQLVAREAHDVGAGGDAVGGRGLIGEQRAQPARHPRQHSGADVVDHRAARGARPARHSSRSDVSSVKPTVRKLRGMHPHQRGRVGPDRALVVGDPGPVRRPDLDQARTRGRQDLGDPERAADLDQLPARDDHLAPAGERRHGQQHRGRVVVDRRAPPPRRSAPAAVPRRAPGGCRARRPRRRTRGSSSRCRSRRARRARSSGSGARPRFVWITTPVALITGNSRGRSRAFTTAAARAASSAAPGAAPLPSRISSRQRSSNPRTTSVAIAREPPSAAPAQRLRLQQRLYRGQRA